MDFQYSYYQESKRDISGMAYNPATQTSYATKLPNNLNPIEVDSLHGNSRISLTNRIKFAFNYTQDTWSGASPLVGDFQALYFDRNLNPQKSTGQIDPSTGQPYVVPSSENANDQ